MKTNSALTKRLYPLLIIVLVAHFSCGGGDDGPGEPPPQEVATEILTSSGWSLAGGGSIMLNDTDVTDHYTGFTLNFGFNPNGTNTYGTTNSGGANGQNRLFSASGTWDWATATTDNVIDIMDNDKSTVTIVTLNENSFVFSFRQLNNAGTASGADGLAGNYDITLTR